MALQNVNSGRNVPDEINVIIEIPANSDPIKYEVDKTTLLLSAKSGDMRLPGIRKLYTRLFS